MSLILNLAQLRSIEESGKDANGTDSDQSRRDREVAVFNKGPIVWDSYFLFGPEATWTNLPSPLISYGNTVLADKEELLEATRALLGS